MFAYTATPDLLSGRVILITGANRGIGAAAAEAFAAHGATVALLGRATEGLTEIANALEQQGYTRPSVHPLDLATAGVDDFAGLSDALAQRYGKLDGLLHNASMLGPRCSLEDTPLDAFQQVVQVNVTALLGLTRPLLPLLRASSDASLVFTSSSVGRKGRAHWGAYAISKFATEGMMQVFADEFAGSTIRANSVNPGGTRTAMRALAYPEENPKTRPTPDAIMPVYLYLMGPQSKGVNGQALDAQ